MGSSVCLFPLREVPQDFIPLWIADMDFKSPPAVIERFTQVAQHGTFGYTGALMNFTMRWSASGRAPSGHGSAGVGDTQLRYGFHPALSGAGILSAGRLCDDEYTGV